MGIKLLKILIFPFALLYGLLMHLRNKCYDWGIFKVNQYHLPIISIGNLNVGGTGKTPHVEFLVKLLKEQYRIATLSRGYGRRTSGYILSDETATAQKIGDEPFQMYRKFGKYVQVAVCEKRARGIKELLNLTIPPQLIILDDAFQHRSVKPGLNILLTDYYKMFTHNYVLPTGTLREFRSGYKRADIIIVTKTPRVFSPIDKRQLLSELKVLDHQKIYFSYISYGRLVSFYTEKIYTEPCKFSVIMMFTGIADSTSLEEELKRYCVTFEKIKFADHHEYKREELLQIREKFTSVFSKSKVLITTEKDYMRLQDPSIRDIFEDLPVYYMPIEVGFHEAGKNGFCEDVQQFVKSYVLKASKN